MQGGVRALLLHGRNVRRNVAKNFGLPKPVPFPRYESSTSGSRPSDGNGKFLSGDGRILEEGDDTSGSEAKRLMRLVDVEALRMKLDTGKKEVIPYSELLKACESIGVARSPDEAASFARELDKAGVVLLFKDKVYLHPDKVVDLLERSVPLALTSKDDPRRAELMKLEDQKQKLDLLARKQANRILWSGLGISMAQVGLFFRLTYWDFSWDVMEPVAFFTTAGTAMVGYAYFLFTAKDPTYRNLMNRLFMYRQRRVFKKHKFDVQRFEELREKCKLPPKSDSSK